MLPPGPRSASPARQLPVPPEELPSWHGQASCLGSGIRFLFCPFHHLSQRARSTRCSPTPRRFSDQHQVGTCYPTSVFSISTLSSFLSSQEHQLMSRRQPLALQKLWTTSCLRGADVLALFHPAAHQALQPGSAAQELTLWDSHCETGDQRADSSMKCSHQEIRALLGAGWLCYLGYVTNRVTSAPWRRQSNGHLSPKVPGR